MSDIDVQARNEVNDALVSSGSAAVEQMVDAANPSTGMMHLSYEQSTDDLLVAIAGGV